MVALVEVTSTARVASHIGRNAKRYAAGGGAVAASGAVAPKVASQAGKQSVGQSDPHYNTNYRAGKATFVDRDRKIRKSLGEAFQEALRGAKSLVTPERAAVGAAVGTGLAYVGSRAAKGFKSGKQEKRQQGLAHGYEDAFKQRREAFDASDFSYLNKDQPTRKRQEEDPFAEDTASGVKNAVGKAIEFRKQHKVKGVGGDAAVNAIGRINESELEEVGSYIRAGKAAAQAAKATRAGRVASKAVPWTSRGLIATDIAVLGGGAAKAAVPSKKPSEQKEGARVSRVASLAGQSLRRGDPLIFGTGTALGVRAKGRDLHDDQKLNQSHIKNQK